MVKMALTFVDIILIIFLRLSHYFGVTFNKRLRSFCELLPLLESERRIIQDVMVVSQWTCGLTVSWPLHSLYPISKHQPDYEKSVSLRLYARSSQTSTWHQGSYIAHLLYCLKPTGFRSSHLKATLTFSEVSSDWPFPLKKGLNSRTIGPLHT